MATEMVTVMFTGLVGSTALLSEVGEQATEELRREHFALLRAAVEPAGGREVKNLSDGLMVVFPSAADAVAAGVAVQRAFERRNRRAVRSLRVRIGVSLGDADVEADPGLRRFRESKPGAKLKLVTRPNTQITTNPEFRRLLDSGKIELVPCLPRRP